MTSSLAGSAGSSAGTLGRWFVMSNGRCEGLSVVRPEDIGAKPLDDTQGVNSMKSGRSSRAPTVSPTIMRLTAASRGADRCQSRGT
jgi:hypothetical protein